MPDSSYTSIERALRDRLSSISNNFMSLETYDSDGDGIIDNATQLNSQEASYYLDWSNFTGTPTTLAGYGITDSFDGKFSSLTNVPTTIFGYGITDAFSGYFKDLKDKPTTLAGYGITSVEDIDVYWEFIKNKPSFSDVSITGDYNSLINTPDISSIVNDVLEDYPFPTGGDEGGGSVIVSGDYINDPGTSVDREILIWSGNAGNAVRTDVGVTIDSSGNILSGTDVIAYASGGSGGSGYYTFRYSLTESGGLVNLSGDISSPGSNKMYGTNISGTKGWYSVPSSMTYPVGTGIATVSGGASWSTTITDNHTDWNTAYGWGNHASAGYYIGTTSTIRALLSSSATGLTYTNTTGVFTITSGYAIPTTTQETNWGTAYSHSQITDGNPHGTDYADVGAIADPGTSVDRELLTWNGTGGYSVRVNTGSKIDANGHILGGYDVIAYSTGSPTGSYWDNLPAATYNVLGHYGGIILGSSNVKFLREDGTWQTVSGAGGGMVYPLGSGIPIVSGGTSWGTTITDSHTNWDSAYSHKTTEDAINGLVKVNGAGSYSSVTDNSSNWNTAYGWGNHASVGYAIKSGTTADNEVAVWTGTTSIEGTSAFTFDGHKLSVDPDGTAGMFYTRARYGGTNTGNILANNGSGNNFIVAEIATSYYSIGYGTIGSTPTNVIGLDFDHARVGIGTTGPSYKLDVTGDIAVGTVGNHLYFDTTGSRGGASLYVDNDYWLNILCNRGTTSKIILKNTPAISFETGASARATITNTGLGIGTASPACLLHLYSAGDNRIYVQSDTVYTQLGAVIGYYGFVGTYTASDFTIRTGDTNRMYFRNSDGNVGIGNTGASDTRLTITGSGSTSSTYGLVSKNSGGTNTFWVRDDGYGYLSGSFGIGTTTFRTQLDIAKDSVYTDYYGQLLLKGATNENKRLAIGFDTTNDIGFIQSYVNGESMKLLYLNPNGGNVAISSPTGLVIGNSNEIWYRGSASDNDTLYINYRGYNDGSSYYRDTRIDNGKGTAVLYVDGSTGYVSIGTGSVSSRRLDVSENRTGDVAAYIYNIHATGYGTKLRGGNTTNYALRVSDYNDSQLLDIIGTGSKIYNRGAVGDYITLDLYQSTATTTFYNILYMDGAMTSVKGYMGIGGAATGNTYFRDKFCVGTQSNHRVNFMVNNAAKAYVDTDGKFYCYSDIIAYSS